MMISDCYLLLLFPFMVQLKRAWTLLLLCFVGDPDFYFYFNDITYFLMLFVVGFVFKQTPKCIQYHRYQFWHAWLTGAQDKNCRVPTWWTQARRPCSFLIGSSSRWSAALSPYWLIQHSGLGDSLKLDKSLLQISITPPPPPPNPGGGPPPAF